MMINSYYSLLLSILLIMIACYPPQQSSSNTAPQIWAVDAMIKVNEDISLSASPTQEISLQAARNEYEPFQIIVKAGAVPLKQIDIAADPLISSKGNKIQNSAITIYREHFINIKTASNKAGKTGLWPDALIPKVDNYFHEVRNAFPVNLTANALLPIWIDLYISADTVADEYRGKIHLLSEGKEFGFINVKLTVWDFQIPATSSLPNSFGFSGLAADIGHYGKYTNDADILDLTVLYSKAALSHRISLHGGSFIPPACRVDQPDRVYIDWQSYDKEVGPFLDGTALPSGAKFTSIDLRTPQYLNSAQQIDYWRQMAQHFQEHGWLDRLFYYVWDEPGAADFEKIRAKATLLKQGDAHLKTLVTKEWQPQLQSAINIWTVLINFIDDKPGNSNAPSREFYDKELAAGNQIWFYQSCMSHGCNVVGDDYFTGWPAYMIDLPSIYSRIMPWIAWKYRIGGELYYNTLEGYLRTNTTPQTIWSDLHIHGGNGDGTLFYPGVPAIIGGQTDIPVESIRLKMIREGLEDYEYLKLAATCTESAKIDELVNMQVKHTYQWDPSYPQLMARRAQLAAIIDHKSYRGR